MNTQPEQPDQDYPRLLKQIHDERLEQEARLKFLRNTSRQIVIQAISKGKISTAKAAELSGHNRATITTWMQIHNAEEKGRATRRTSE